MTVNIVLSGPGLIGRRHAEIIAANSETLLTAVVGPPSQHNVSAALEFGAPLYPTLAAACDSVPVDGVIISAPNRFHFEQTVFCVERALPVLVEKPLTDTLSSARMLRDLTLRCGARVLVGHHRTYNPYLQATKTFVESREFGDPVMFQGAALFYKPSDYFEAGHWRTQPGGGPMLLNMIHEIGIMRMMFGEIESVFAMSGNDRRGFPVEDTVSIALRFCNGAFGSFALSDVTASTKSWEMTTGENPAYPIIQDQNCYHLAGTNGSLDFPSMVARTYGTGPRSWWVRQQEWSIGVAVKEPLALQVAHFVDVIRGHALPMVSIEDGYRNLLVLDAMTTSARTSRPILVEAVERELINSVPSQVQL